MAAKRSQQFYSFIRLIYDLKKRAPTCTYGLYIQFTWWLILNQFSYLTYFTFKNNWLEYSLKIHQIHQMCVILSYFSKSATLIFVIGQVFSAPPLWWLNYTYIRNLGLTLWADNWLHSTRLVHKASKRQYKHYLYIHEPHYSKPNMHIHHYDRKSSW